MKRYMPMIIAACLALAAVGVTMAIVKPGH